MNDLEKNTNPKHYSLAERVWYVDACEGDSEWSGIADAHEDGKQEGHTRESRDAERVRGGGR